MYTLDHWPLRDAAVISKVYFFQTHFTDPNRIVDWALTNVTVKLLPDECHITALMRSQQLTFVQVIAWCHQETSHYLSQCWPKPMSPYGITRPPWVNRLTSLRPEQNRHHGTILQTTYSNDLCKGKFCTLINIFVLKSPIDNKSVLQSSKLAGSPKSEVSEIMFRTSETILVLVRSDY